MPELTLVVVVPVPAPELAAGVLVVDDAVPLVAGVELLYVDVDEGDPAPPQPATTAVASANGAAKRRTRPTRAIPWMLTSGYLP